MAVSRWRTFVWNGQAQFRLALPIMGAQLAQTGMALVDTLMTGHYAAVDLAAVSVGSSLWLPLYLLIAGVLMAVTPHVARIHGSGRYAGLAAYLQTTRWLAVALGVVGGLLLMLATPLFRVMGVEEAVADRGQAYLFGVAAGFPALALYHVLRGLSEGMHHVRPVLLIGLLGLAINVPANYLLIYGGFGLPAMGALGCGIATALSMWVMAGGMAWYISRHPRFRGLSPLARRYPLHWFPVRETLFVGVPIGLAIFFEVSLFAAIALLVAGLGTTVVAAHQIALNFTALLFMVPLSMGIALTVRVGDALGRDQPQLARQRSLDGMMLCVLTGLLLALLMVRAAGQVVRLYTP
ncbi:MAG: MATE family efflux transporter, partial [Ectothiorhodospiraceae bacterium]|nr:MATE family efflux transporter [Ectothiorhodospiraceae bacterium]